MAKIAANNPFANLTAKPEDIRITWPQQTLVSANAQVTVVGYRNPWDKPYLKKVELFLNNHNLNKYLLLYLQIFIVINRVTVLGENFTSYRKF